MKGHAEREPASGLIEERISYDEKGDKIKNGELAPYTPESAAQEVEDSRKLYDQLTERSQSRKRVCSQSSEFLQSEKFEISNYQALKS